MKSRFCSTRIMVSPLLVAQPLQGLDDLVDDRGLDTLGRLVEQDKARLAAKATRDRQQLLLAPESAPPGRSSSGFSRGNSSRTDSMVSCSAPACLVHPMRRLS